MRNNEAQQKVTARHLARQAYLYVRQSTLRQVMENTESTKRQYALRQRAIAMGWPADQIVVIDSDLGQSGASAADRAGFQRLVADVGLGRAGIVMGLEVSRLARNCSDWHRLLEICALTDTLILDEDGLYEPGHFNDRLLLGLKGTMSEAELHLLRARLRGGIVSKARRGELEVPLPIGLVYDSSGKVVLDPDRQVQQAVRTLFETFRRTGSAAATVKFFREQALRFPRRVAAGPGKGEIVWGDLEHSRVLWILHNPRYAGAFFFGRTRQQKLPGATGRYRRLPREEWIALLPDSHPGYITWNEFEQNKQRLSENSAAHGHERRHGPPREGPALLQGLVLCGRCGERMTLRYVQRRDQLSPYYVCQRAGIQKSVPICQSMPGADIDAAVGELIVSAVTPTSIEVALAVQQELQARSQEADTLRRQQVERARYDAEAARRRYMRVDPDNRLVADAIEAQWNEKLRAVRQAEEEYERQRQADRLALDEAQRARILALATDLPRLWRDPGVADRERKRMARLLLEDVTLLRNDDGLIAHVRFRGGATRTLTLPRPLPAWRTWQTDPEVVAEIDRLLDNFTDAQIARILNDNSRRSGKGKSFTPPLVWRLRRDYHLRSRYDRLRAAGMLTGEEIASRLDLSPATVKDWRAMGWLKAHAYDDKPHYLYDPPGPDTPPKWKHKKRLRRPAQTEAAPHVTKEVQYEA